MGNDNNFRLSRIEAEGWNAAQRYMAEESAKPDDIRVADFNPYGSGAARSRWAVGFRNAVAAMGAR